jgi:hypothetical protein
MEGPTSSWGLRKRKPPNPSWTWWWNLSSRHLKPGLHNGPCPKGRKILFNLMRHCDRLHELKALGWAHVSPFLCFGYTVGHILIKSPAKGPYAKLSGDLYFHKYLRYMCVFFETLNWIARNSQSVNKKCVKLALPYGLHFFGLVPTQISHVCNFPYFNYPTLYRVIPSVLDPRKSEYLKDYSLFNLIFCKYILYL